MGQCHQCRQLRLGQPRGQLALVQQPLLAAVLQIQPQVAAELTEPSQGQGLGHVQLGLQQVAASVFAQLQVTLQLLPVGPQAQLGGRRQGLLLRRQLQCALQPAVLVFTGQLDLQAGHRQFPWQPGQRTRQLV